MFVLITFRISVISNNLFRDVFLCAIQSIMGDIQSHNASLHEVLVLSRDVHLNDPVSTILARITGRFQNIQTQAKVILLKSIAVQLLIRIFSANPNSTCFNIWIVLHFQIALMHLTQLSG